MAKWTKGVSGNPGGRPSGVGDLREIARQHTRKAIQTLVAVMNDASAAPSARVGAASALLDRGWGRAPQTIHTSNDANHDIEARLQGDLSDLLGKFVAEPENTREAGSAPIVDGGTEGDAPASGVTH